MSKEDLLKVKDLSKEQVLDGMKKQEITPPRGKKAREEFMDFLNLSGDDRGKYLAEKYPEPDAQPPKPDGKGEEPLKPDESSDGKPPELPPVPEAQPPEPPPVDDGWVQEFGYKDHSEAKNAHKNLVDLAARHQKTIDRITANEGKRGRELKELQQRNAQLEEELEKHKPEVKKPKCPVRPNPSDKEKYPEGIYDQKYIEDMEAHEVAMVKYEDDFDVFRTHTLEKARVPAPQQPTDNSESESAVWSKLFDEDIPEIQKRFNIPTTVSIRQISESYNALDPRNAKSYTQEQKDAAKIFLEGVPSADKEAYAKVRQAIEAVYDFDSGVPILKYRTIDGGLFDNNMLGEGKLFNVTKPVPMNADQERAARDKAAQKKDDSVSAIPASEAAGQDPKPSDQQTAEEEIARYRNLMTEYNVALNKGQGAAFEASEKYQEWLRLRKKLTGKLPKRLS